MFHMSNVAVRLQVSSNAAAAAATSGLGVRCARLLILEIAFLRVAIDSRIAATIDCIGLQHLAIGSRNALTVAILDIMSRCGVFTPIGKTFDRVTLLLRGNHAALAVVARVPRSAFSFLNLEAGDKPAQVRTRRGKYDGEREKSAQQIV